MTLPWLSAHSIRTGIGGDIYILILEMRLSSDQLHLCRESGRVPISEKYSPKRPPIIDTFLATMLILLVLEAALLRAEGHS